MKIENGKLTIFANDTTMFSLLESGKREIERALSWQGLDLVVEIVQLEKTLSKAFCW